MEIIIGNMAGFCGGVRNAVTKTEKELETNSQIDCLGELVHNKEVIQELENKGLHTIQTIEEEKNKVIIRAHGIEKEIYEKAKEKEIELIDCTCPKVLNIHKLVQEYSEKGYFIVLVGESKHPEVIGTYSFCGEYKKQLSKQEEINQLVEEIVKSGKTNILVVAQTTFHGEKFELITKEIKEKLKEMLGDKLEIKIENTICNATALRQQETKELATNVDFMIIIGGRNSSNTNKLYEIAKQYGKGALLIENKSEIDIKDLSGVKTIGIMAGASTPEKSILDVVEYIKKES